MIFYQILCIVHVSTTLLYLKTFFKCCHQKFLVIFLRTVRSKNIVKDHMCDSVIRCLF